MKTRTKRKAPTAADTAEEPAKVKGLPVPDSNPPKIVILPKDASTQAKIITLQNPATSSPNRYFFCPTLGLYEFTRIAAPKQTPRSWLLSGAEEATEEEILQHGVSNSPSVEDKYLVQEPDMLVATPFDPIFLLLPVLLPSTNAPGSKQMFLALDDHLDALASHSPHMNHLLSVSSFRMMLEKRMTAVCDAVDAGEEKMYRISQNKLVGELIAKAKKMCANGLPSSMEEHFVKDTLKAPVLSLENQQAPGTLENGGSQADEVGEGPGGDLQISTDSIPEVVTNVDSNPSATSSSSSLPKEDPVKPKQEQEAPEEIKKLLQLKTALEFLMSSYCPRHIKTAFDYAVHENTSIDFGPLDAHLDQLGTIRRQAQALRNISDNISRKRAAINDDEVIEARAEKKRKKEEEEKRKKSESRAVKDLKKADTSGMKKLSAFFAKKPMK